MGILDRITGRTAAPAKMRAFDAGKANRRLRGLTTSTVAIDSNIKRYGKTVLARSRYLAANNPYASAAKKTFISALVGSGIKPSSLVSDANLKKAIQEAWLDWTDEADAEGLTDLYGLQAKIASEMFEAGECFIRLRARRPEDGLSVPLQLQILPAEMLPLGDNRTLPNGSVEMGIQYDAIGKRVGYHFLRQHPGADPTFGATAGETTFVPASEVMHAFDPTQNAGQTRGIPHTLSGIVVAAIMDCYDDAELERKRTAALFGAFVTRPAIEDSDHPLEDGITASDVLSGIALEPGAIVDLADGEDIKFSEPADVGGSYEAFQYRNLLRMAAGFGVPYAAMTGDLRQTSYGSIRAGLVEFRRRVEAMQHHVMVFQFCRPIWQRWMDDAVLALDLLLSPTEYARNRSLFQRVKWIAPRWEWIDPLKDRAAELLAVKAGFKSRSDVVEAEGYDPEENDQRIAADRDREESLDLKFNESQFADSLVAALAAPDEPAPQPGQEDDA